MKDHPPSPIPEEISLGLTIYKPEEELFQRLPLCKYLSELPEISEAVTEDPDLKKKD